MRHGGDTVTGILRDASRSAGPLAVEIAGRWPGVVYLRAVLPSVPDAGAVVVDAVGWVVAALLDGRRTARDVAWGAGLEVFETVLAVGRLATAGLCTTARIAPPPQWAEDLLAQVDIGPEIILRLIDGIKRLDPPSP